MAKLGNETVFTKSAITGSFKPICLSLHIITSPMRHLLANPALKPRVVTENVFGHEGAVQSARCSNRSEGHRSVQRAPFDPHGAKTGRQSVSSALFSRRSLNQQRGSDLVMRAPLIQQSACRPGGRRARFGLEGASVSRSVQNALVYPDGAVRSAGRQAIGKALLNRQSHQPRRM